MARLEDAIVRTQRELRQQILEQRKSFLDEIQSTRHALTEMLERELGFSGALGAEGEDRGEWDRPTP